MEEAPVDESPHDPPARPRRLTFGFATALAIVGAVVLSVVLAGAVSAASQPLGWALACAVVAGLIRPLVDFLGRRMSNGLAVILTLLVLALVVGGAWAGTLATVTDNVDTLTEEAPEAAAQIEVDNQAARDFELEARVTAFVDDLDSRLGRGAQVTRSASTVSSYVVSGILVIFLIVYGPRFTHGAVDQIDDPDERSRISTIGSEAVSMWRRYVLSTLVQVIVVTLLAWLVLWAVDLPAPFVLALIIGGFSAIPYIGVVLGGLPAVLFALATADTPRILVVLALILVLQAIEALIVRPRVDAASLYVGPALPLIVTLVGWSFYGLGGAVYSVILLILALAVADAVAAHPSDGLDPAPTAESPGTAPV
jgi:predicted PurR-regulated permease PerM